jgi:hypothetical protein
MISVLGHVYAVPQHMDTVYGKVTVDDPLAAELILSPPFQRLKQINQYGVVNYIAPTEVYSRFDHSLGVYILLKKIGAPRVEQIAGLLHDVSHTVFSHVGDYVFQDQYPGTSYQDDIHLWYLKESGLHRILEKHQLSAEAVTPKHTPFSALDQKLPNLCADRIEYNLQGGLLRGLLTLSQFEKIVQSIHFEDGLWFCDDLESAVLLGNCSLVMTETLWGAPWEILSYMWAAEALRRAFEIELVTFDEFHFSTDDLVWNKLIASQDPVISERMVKMHRVHDYFELTDERAPDLVLRSKFRGIDPLVRFSGQLHPLSLIDPIYSQEFNRVKLIMERGWFIKLKYD